MFDTSQERRDASTATQSVVWLPAFYRSIFIGDGILNLANYATSLRKSHAIVLANNWLKRSISHYRCGAADDSYSVIVIYQEEADKPVLTKATMPTL
jgi:hypothetical protein